MAEARPLLGAVEGGGSKFLCAIAGRDGAVLHSQELPTRDPDATLAAVSAFFAPYANELAGLGVATFGPLTLAGEARGTLLTTPKQGWSGTPLARRLEDGLSVPVVVDTDVNGALLAEARWGALTGTSSAVYVTVGTGVGVGVMAGGARLYGRMHPELGHLPAHDPAFGGACPFHGSCVEGLVSAPALFARTGALPETLPDDHPVWAASARVLGTLLATIALAYAPERIALGGGVLARNGLRAASARACLAALGGYLPWPELREAHADGFVVAPTFGTRAGLCGAFALAGLERAPRFA